MTLLEVLIALLVLSIGVVGIGVLHLNSIKYAHSSYYTSVATALALDFEERMWIAVVNEGGCIDQGSTAIDQIQGTLLQLWGNSNGQPGAVALPDLKIDPIVIWPEQGDHAHTDVDLTISWAEGRFEDMDNNEEMNNNNGRETFHYRARVICYRSPE